MVGNQTSFFGTFAELLYFLRHPVMVQSYGSNVGAELISHQGERLISQSATAQQHDKVSEVQPSGLSRRYLGLVPRLRSGALFPELFANLSWCFGCPDQAPRTDHRAGTEATTQAVGWILHRSESNLSFCQPGRDLPG